MSGEIETGLAVLTEKVTSIDTKLDIQLAHIKSNVDSKASKADVKALTDRVDKIESDKSWAARVVAGAIILAIVGLVLAKPHVSFGDPKPPTTVSAHWQSTPQYPRKPSL